ncbi:hypothetical protein MBLNU457_6823t1 [Dothideomycetes sp. NU457]
MALSTPNDGEPHGRTLATLAPELLDLIFANLLKVTDDHCHITGVTDSADSGARKLRPKLHTAILLANRRLAELGRRYLYGQNSFVVVRYDLSNGHQLIRRLLVRYVAKKRIDDFKHHVLKYSFGVKNERPDGMPSQAGRLLLREEDLEPFLRKLQVLVFANPADLVYLIPPSWPTGRLDARYIPPAVKWLTSIVVNETPFHTQNNKSDERLLKHFQFLGGTRGPISVKGVSEDLQKSVSAHLTTRFAFVESMGWSLLYSLRTYEDAAGDLFDLGEPLPLVIREAYSFLLQFATENRLTNPNGSSPGFAPTPGQGTPELGRIQPEVVDTWQCGVHLLTIDLLLTNIAFVIAAKTHAERRLMGPLTQHLILYLERPLHLFGKKQEIQLPAEQAARVYHTIVIVRGFDPLLNETLLEEQEQGLKMALELEKDDPGLLADLAIVRKCRRDRVSLTTESRSHGHQSCKTKLTVALQKSPRLDYSNSCFRRKWLTRCKWPLELRPIHEDFRGWFDTALPLHPATIDTLNKQADNLYYDRSIKVPKFPVDDPNDPFWQEEIRKMNERNARQSNQG